MVRGAGDETGDIFGRIAADSKARQEDAGKALAEKLDAYSQPIPTYAVRGVGGTPVAALLAQSQQQAQSIRQPEWWAQGLVGGGTVIADWLWNLPAADSYAERMVRDPIYRELRRASLVAKLQSSLNDATAYARVGRDDMARQKLQHADSYRRDIEAIDKAS